MCPTFNSFAALLLNLTSAIATVANMRVCVNCPRDGAFMLIVWSSLDIIRRKKILTAAVPDLYCLHTWSPLKL